MDEKQDAARAPEQPAASTDAAARQGAADSSGAAERPPHATEEPQIDEQQLNQELEQERARAAEYLDEARRTRAELLNYKRRTEQEIEQIRRHAGERLIGRLLPVIDDFHRAIEHVPADERENPWIQGILLIERKLWSILESEGVQPIESVGKPFNPSVHEAVTVDDGGGADTVVEEFQRGYTLHDRVIRPAMVKVGRNRTSQGANASSTSGTSNPQAQ